MERAAQGGYRDKGLLTDGGAKRGGCRRHGGNIDTGGIQTRGEIKRRERI